MRWTISADEKMASDVSEAEIGSIEIPKTAKARMVRTPDDYVVENFDFEKLASSNEVAGDLDVRFRRTRITAGMVVLCEAPVYVQFGLIRVSPTALWQSDSCDGTAHNVEARNRLRFGF